MKYRSETRTRSRDKTIDGRTHKVDEQYKVQVPVPPKDRDAQALKAVTLLAVFIVTGAIVWSTVAIGSLLGLAFHPIISYAIACVFDATWIGLMTLEWIARYDPERASLPRNMGWVALALSMALITAHGAVSGFLWVGVAGAAVSLVAKSFWHVVMKTTEARLDTATAQWVASERSEVDGQRALVSVHRQLERSRAQAREEAEALSGQPELLELRWSAEGVTHERLKEVAQNEVSAAQSTRAQRIERLTELLSAQPDLTGPEVAQLMSVSEATAKRDLKEVRSR